MGKRYYTIAVFVCMVTGAYGQKSSVKTPALLSPARLVSERDSMQYILGAFVAQWLHNNGFYVSNPLLFSMGMNDVLQNKPRLVPDSLLAPTISLYQRSLLKELAVDQEKELFRKLRDQPGIGILPNGVCFVILKAGRGQHPAESDSIVINLTAKLINGTVVEDTYQSQKPFRATASSFFPGLNESLLMMPVGSKWQLFVPAVLAYGEKGTTLIPPGSALILEAELMEILTAQN